METISDDVRWNRLFLRKTELEIKRIFDAYRSIGVEPILLKGWASARNYPANVPRHFTDIDLAILSEDFEKCLEQNRSEWLSTLNIDLHREFRHLDTAPWGDLFARSKLVRVEGTDVRILCPEDHLRVICTHWLTDGGQYKERLWDVYYAVENRPANFDWELCLETVSPTRRNWVVTTIAIAKNHLELDTDVLPFAAELESYPAWIDTCLEKEWSSEVRLRPLNASLGHGRQFLQQVRKRIPPNPIQATIEGEGMFDERSRLPYQLKSIAARIHPSIKRLWRELPKRIWRRPKN